MDQQESDPESTLIEEEAKSKIRDFLSDPKLKFHFSRPYRLQQILSQGIISKSFADRAKLDYESNLGIRNPRLISISDRVKNNEWGDWWLIQFASERDNIGYLLPSDLEIESTTPHPSESQVKFRISPRQIEGIFVMDTKTLQEPISQIDYSLDATGFVARYTLALEKVSDFNRESIRKNHPRLKYLEHELRDLRQGVAGMKYKDWPEGVKKAISLFIDREDEIIDEIAKKQLEELIGKPAETITQLDLYTHFAKKAGIPIYIIDKNLLAAKVVWPPVGR
ncbi:hypothetical protein HYW46_03695 [Candidatus Daviesbacteria bacterium]|nr:hypothetical protein [Candidatus Daviesbacteria bacterium]